MAISDSFPAFPAPPKYEDAVRAKDTEGFQPPLYGHFLPG